MNYTHIKSLPFQVKIAFFQSKMLPNITAKPYWLKNNRTQWPFMQTQTNVIVLSIQTLGASKKFSIYNDSFRLDMHTC